MFFLHPFSILIGSRYLYILINVPVFRNQNILCSFIFETLYCLNITYLEFCIRRESEGGFLHSYLRFQEEVMASSRKVLFCLVLSFCLLNSALSMPYPPEEDEEEGNELNFEDGPEEIPEDELLAEKEESEISDDDGDEKELDLEHEEANEEKELEAEEKELVELEKDLEDENKEDEIDEKDLEEENEEDEIDEKELEEEIKEDEIAEKDLEEENKEDEIAEKDFEEENKEDEIAEKDSDSSDDEVYKNEGGIIFPDVDDKKEIPDEEFFHKGVMDSEAGGPHGGFDEEGNEKHGFVRRYFRKIKDFFKGLGK